MESLIDFTDKLADTIFCILLLFLFQIFFKGGEIFNSGPIRGVPEKE